MEARKVIVRNTVLKSYQKPDTSRACRELRLRYKRHRLFGSSSDGRYKQRLLQKFTYKPGQREPVDDTERRNSQLRFTLQFLWKI